MDAVYTVTSKDGVWDSRDNNTYTITLQKKQVADVLKHWKEKTVAGTFVIGIAAKTRSAAGIIAAPAFTEVAPPTPTSAGEGVFSHHPPWHHSRAH